MNKLNVERSGLKGNWMTPRGEFINTLAKMRQLSPLFWTARSQGKLTKTVLEEFEHRTAEEFSRLKSAFLTNISHELKTPVTSIKGMAQSLLMTDMKWDTETVKDFLATIDRESDHLIDMIEDMIDMAQIEGGVMSLHKDIASIEMVIQQLNGTLSNTLGEHDLELKLSSNLPQTRMDVVRIGQVIANLVEDAVIHSPKDEPITIESGVSDNNLIVSIINRGTGISRTHQATIFEKFDSLEKNVEYGRRGSCLKLAISEGIVKAHNGKMWMESKRGQGAKFIFSLPIVKK